MKDPRARIAAENSTQVPETPRLDRYLALARNRSYVLDTLGMTAMTFALGGMSAWMPKYLVGDPLHGGRGLPQWSSAVFGGILAATGLLATFLGGMAGDKLRGKIPGSYFVVSAAGMFMACPFIVAMLYLPFPWAWIPLSIAVFFLFFNTGPTNAILANVTHPSVRATAFGLNILILHLLGDAAAPPLLGGLAGHAGWNVAFLVVAAACALAGIFWLIGARYLHDDVQRVESATATESAAA
jgi:MFS family permease